ncbi:MAG: hypothetical protein ACLPKE_31840 [Streptosporangiaceae bacterium]
MMSGRHRGEPKRPDPCAWPGCGKRTRPAYLMCRAHWYRLPADLRSRIWDTYRSGQTAATCTPEYRDALAAVLAYARRVNAEAEQAAQRQAQAEAEQETLW